MGIDETACWQTKHQSPVKNLTLTHDFRPHYDLRPSVSRRSDRPDGIVLCRSRVVRPIGLVANPFR